MGKSLLLVDYDQRFFPGLLPFYSHIYNHSLEICATCSLYPRTLIDSTPGVLKAWQTFASDYALGDSAAIAHATHGRRLYDTFKEYCKIDDEEKLLVSIIL